MTPRALHVDVHAHVMPPEAMGAAGRYGPEIIETGNGLAVVRVGEYASRIGGARGLSAEAMRRLHDPAIRLREMDEKGIDVMALSVSPLFYLYWAEPEISIPFATVQNEGLARYCARDPARLFFMATLPLPHVDASLEELDNAVRLGAKAINIGTGSLGGGLELDSPELWPLYDAIEERGLPLFVHPYPSPMSDGTLDRYNLSWIVGYNSQETEAFARITLGGVLDDFPGLKVIVTHGGGFVPYQFGRLEEARKRQPDVRAKKPLDEYLANFYFDILVHDCRARHLLLDFAGPDQVVVGDNYGGWDAVDGFGLLDELALDAETYSRIAGENAIALLDIPTAAARDRGVA